MIPTPLSTRPIDHPRNPIQQMQAEIRRLRIGQLDLALCLVAQQRIPVSAAELIEKFAQTATTIDCFPEPYDTVRRLMADQNMKIRDMLLGDEGTVEQQQDALDAYETQLLTMKAELENG